MHILHTVLDTYKVLTRRIQELLLLVVIISYILATLMFDSK